MSSEQLERGLQASVKIFQFSKGKLAQLAEHETECSITRDELSSMRKAAAAMNRALTALVRESHDAENRLTLELHMLRGIMKRESIDRDANRARVFEMFRQHIGGATNGEALATLSSSGGAASTSTANANPLNTPSASAVAIDKALAGLERLEQSMRDISPVGRVNTHGAGLLAAKRKRDSLAEAATKQGESSVC